jgi:hypothetical protein
MHVPIPVRMRAGVIFCVIKSHLSPTGLLKRATYSDVLEADTYGCVPSELVFVALADAEFACG